MIVFRKEEVMGHQFQKEESSPYVSREEEDQWILDAISLSYRRQVDQQENPHLKLQKILSKIPSSLNISDQMLFKALTSMRTFLKKHVVEVGKTFDGDIPEPIHHHWIDMEMAYENVDMAMNLGRDASADLKIYLNMIKALNDDFLKMQY